MYAWPTPLGELLSTGDHTAVLDAIPEDIPDAELDAAIADLRAALLAGQVPRARNTAALALAFLGADEAAADLAALLRDPNTLNMRGVLLEALGELDYRPFLAALVDVAYEGPLEATDLAITLLIEGAEDAEPAALGVARRHAAIAVDAFRRVVGAEERLRIADGALRILGSAAAPAVDWPAKHRRKLGAEGSLPWTDTPATNPSTLRQRDE